MKTDVAFKSGDRVRLTVDNDYLGRYHGAFLGELGTITGDLAGVTSDSPVTTAMVAWDSNSDSPVRCGFDELELAIPAEELPSADEVAATFRLSMMRLNHRDLSRAEAKARVQLAAAIVAMDETEGVPGRHNLHEQAAVGRATEAYAQALADLLRGETA